MVVKYEIEWLVGYDGRKFKCETEWLVVFYGCSLGRLNMRLNGWVVMVVKLRLNVWLIMVVGRLNIRLNG